jgi:DNA repair protein RadA/Sms
LSGAIRPVPQSAARLKEAAKLGFQRALAPESARSEGVEAGLQVTAIGTLASLVAEIAGSEERHFPGRRQARR